MTFSLVLVSNLICIYIYIYMCPPPQIQPRSEIILLLLFKGEKKIGQRRGEAVLSPACQTLMFAG